MKIIYNNPIPFKGFKAINIFGVLFARRGAMLSTSGIQHESIHTAQMRELGYVLFYIIYLLEWIGRLAVGLCRRRPLSEAYYCIRFEHEAYTHHADPGYLDRRRRWEMWR